MFWRKRRWEAELDNAVRSAAKPALAVKPIPLIGLPYSLNPTETRFGGAPYAEAGDTWPMIGHRPYDFIAQFNFQNIADFPNPRFGLLTVFLCWTARDAIDLEKACIVRAYPQPDVGKAILLQHPPQRDADDYFVIPCAAELSTVVTYPSGVNSFKRVPEIQRAVARFKDPWRAYQKSLKRIGYHEEFGTRLYGYPSWIQDNTLDDDKLEFVLQVGSDPLPNLEIGDAGCIFVAASKTDPPRFETDPCQCF